MEKINIAELLKDCPKGMELDCVMYNDVTLRDVDCSSYPIQVQTPEGNMNLSRYGCMSLSEHARCIIFPKGKTTWEGFVPPCKFKDGDIVTNIEGAVIIYKGITTCGYCGSFVSLDHCNQFIPHYKSYLTDTIRFATEEEKQKLFQAIKDRGYKWDSETKTLEKLIIPKFKVGVTMAQLAIKGHSKRGKEVIEILEMLGGENIHNYGGTFNECYTLDNNKICTIYKSVAKIDNCIIFTLEEFLEKYPYKVGNKVQHKGATSCGSVYEVEKMRWVDDHVEYEVKRLWCWNDHYTFTAEDLQPFEEETMEENLTIQDIRDNNAEWLLNKLREMPAEGTLRTISDLYDELRKPQYPKTYKECCEVVGAQSTRHWIYTKKDKIDYPHEIKIINYLDALRKLLICRDAYLKKASERMKLGNPWEPDWTIYEYKFTIVEIADIVVKSVDICNKHILAFPTEEMRDAFYENFKDLIEACKEFL